MSKLGILGSNAFLALLVAGAAASAVACSKQEEKKAWHCHAADVPMGEVVRCTQSALGDVDMGSGWSVIETGGLVTSPTSPYLVGTDGTASTAPVGTDVTGG